MIELEVSYKYADTALDWAEESVDGRTYDALKAILDYAHAVDEKLREVMEHNKLGDGS